MACYRINKTDSHGRVRSDYASTPLPWAYVPTLWPPVLFSQPTTSFYFSSTLIRTLTTTPITFIRCTTLSILAPFEYLLGETRIPSIKGGKLLRKATKKSIPLNFEIFSIFFNLVFPFYLFFPPSPLIIMNEISQLFVTNPLLFKFDKFVSLPRSKNKLSLRFFLYTFNLKTTSEGIRQKIPNTFLRIRVDDALVRHDIQTKRIRKLI